MNNGGFSGILIEAIEVLINQVLYLREVYPSGIFTKRRIYNTPIYISIYPPLNTYLCNVLNAARELLNTNELVAVELLIHNDEAEINELYKFCISERSSVNEINENFDEYLLEFERNLQFSLHKMAERINALDKLRHDVQCQVLLHLSENAFVKFSQKPLYQDFPWVRASSYKKFDNKDIFVLPITEISMVGLELIAEI